MAEGLSYRPAVGSVLIPLDLFRCNHLLIPSSVVRFLYSSMFCVSVHFHVCHRTCTLAVHVSLRPYSCISGT